MNRTRVTMFVSIALLATTTWAGGPAPSPAPPSAVIFNGSFDFHSSSDQYPATVNVPQDGAWFYGTAKYDGASWMDCDHHYEVDLVPSSASPDYNPFLKVGFVIGIDTPCQFSNACFSCSLNFGGFKPQTYYTTNNAPGWLPAGTAQAVLHTQNGGSVGTIPGDTVTLSLNQVNASALQNMTVFEANANDFPAEASPDEINSRAYIAGGDDHLPLVPQFAYGVDTYPAPPGATFTAAWDTGDQANVMITNPYGKPGNVILLIDIPRIKTGNHKVTVTAKLPSGKTYQAPAYQVFVYNVALEVLVNGTVTNAPVSFPRGANMVFRVQQQDTKGKTIKITKADWVFNNLNGTTPIKINSVDEPGFAINSSQWGGTMVAPGLLSVSLTLQTGKQARTTHSSLATFAAATARTDAQWQTKRQLCEDCFDDLAIKHGGFLPQAVVFPSLVNVQSDQNFPAQPTGGITLGLTGERGGYANGLVDNSGNVSLESHTLLKPLPLYRPLNQANDPAEWPNRFTLSGLTTGPNRTYWYVTQQNYHTDWAYAVSAFFKPDSAPGASPVNYTHWVYDPACGNQGDEACYQNQSITACWISQTTLSYYQAASQRTNPNTGSPYDMAGVLANVKAHEKGFHYQLALVDYINNHKAQYDIGSILESLALVGPNEASVRAFVDDLVFNINKNYSLDPLGGGNERVDPPGDIPIVDDTNGCRLYP